MKRKTRATRKKLEASLAQLENAGLVRHLANPDADYVFKHALVQEAACESLLIKARGELHHRVAQAYESIYAERCLDEFAAILAGHYAAAGDDAKTLDYATRAGDQAARVYANTEAIAHYALALEVGKRQSGNTSVLIHLYARRGRAFELQAKYDQALVNYKEMEDLARARGDRALELEALTLRATALSVGGRFIDLPKAQALSSQALVLARELGDRPAEARVYWNLLLINRFGNEGPLKAIEYGEQSIAIARELGAREQLAMGLRDMMPPLLAVGQFERAKSAVEEAEALWRGMDNKPMLAETLAGQALLYGESGELERGRRACEEAYALNKSMDDRFGLNTSGGFLSWINLELGRVDQFLALAEESIQAGHDVGLEQLTGLARIHVALTLVSLGALARGLEQAEAATANTEIHAPSMRAFPLAATAHLHLSAGNLAAAQALLQQVPLASFEEYSRQLRGPDPSYVVVMAHAELALAQGEAARTIAILDDLLAALERAHVLLFIPDTLHLKAQALLHQNRIDEAHALLVDARRRAESMHARFRLFPILCTLTETETRLGNHAEADRVRAQAREHGEYIAAHTPPDLRASFLALPQVRAVFREDSTQS